MAPNSPLIIFTFVASTAFYLATALTNSLVDDMKKDLAIAMLRWQQNDRHPLIGGAVRVGFHDCVGGCDGCINHDLLDNAGLKRYTDVLDDIYTKYENNISRADFYSLGAVTALDIAQQAGGKIKDRHTVRFRYGRQDCPSSPWTNVTQSFPLATDGLKHSTKYFKEVFAMSTQDTVALLGAHTLGKVHLVNSGFGDLRWVGKSDKLDNEYYKDMEKSGWRTNTTVVEEGRLLGKHHFWNRGQNADRIMLNADMSLLLDFGADTKPNDLPSCSFESCPKSETADLVHTYATNITRWYNDFSNAFQRLLETGTEGLKEPTGPGGGVVEVPDIASIAQESKSNSGEINETYVEPAKMCGFTDQESESKSGEMNEKSGGLATPAKTGGFTNHESESKSSEMNEKSGGQVVPMKTSGFTDQESESRSSEMNKTSGGPVVPVKTGGFTDTESESKSSEMNEKSGGPVVPVKTGGFTDQESESKSSEINEKSIEPALPVKACGFTDQESESKSSEMNEKSQELEVPAENGGFTDHESESKSNEEGIPLGEPVIQLQNVAITDQVNENKSSETKIVSGQNGDINDLLLREG